MQTLVIYHAGCWDGFCAAWLFSEAFPDAQFHAAHYGTEPPDVTDQQVFIADFSYKRPVMRQVLSQAHSVVILDHHKTAEAELSGIVDEFTQRPDLIQNPPGSELPVVWFDGSKSGGRLAWEYLCRRNDVGIGFRRLSELEGYSVQEQCDTPPWLVNYTEDRDLWRHALPSSREVNAALRSYPLDFAVWDQLHLLNRGTKSWEAFIGEGRAILRSERQIIDTHVRNAREVEMDGHKVLSVNATVLFSDIAGELAKDRPFGVCWFDRQDGKRQYSLRSRSGGVDVSEIAKAHGGGGHRDAAGFEA